MDTSIGQMTLLYTSIGSWISGKKTDKIREPLIARLTFEAAQYAEMMGLELSLGSFNDGTPPANLGKHKHSCKHYMLRIS